MRDLAQEVLIQGHEPIVVVPADRLEAAWATETLDGVKILRLAAHRTKDIGYVRRFFGELLLPFAMYRSMKKSPYRNSHWDAVVWYSPTIFLGPLVWMLKRSSRCPTYLILRDIFPEWTLDLGLLRKGPAYYFFKLIAAFQYAIADTIGVQSASNLAYLTKWEKPPKRRLEVLQNWLALAPDVGSSIRVADTILAGKKIFVYVGNMGVAQGTDVFIDLAESLKHREDLGFIFVGRGTDVERLSAMARERTPKNTLFCNEIDSREIPGLLAQCRVGLLALDPRHKTHNIPGKFLTYMQAGLPVLARVNGGTDLAHLIEKEAVGCVYVGESVDILSSYAEQLADDDIESEEMGLRGRALGARMFSPATAVRHVIAALASDEA